MATDALFYFATGACTPGDGNRLVVRDERGTNAYTVPDDFRLTVDGKKMAVKELKPGIGYRDVASATVCGCRLAASHARRTSDSTRSTGNPCRHACLGASYVCPGGVTHGPRGIRDSFGSSRKQGWHGKPMLILTLAG